MRVAKELSGFSLLEVLIAVVIMALAVVPISVGMFKQSEVSNHNNLYVKAMHISGTILNRMLKEVPFTEIVKDFSLPTGETGVLNAMPEIIVTDLRSLKAGTPEAEIFTDLKFNAPEDSGLAFGTANSISFSPRDDALDLVDANEALKVFYQMRIQRLDREFGYYKNNIVNPDTGATGTEENLIIDGNLMRITLIAGWRELTISRDQDRKVYTNNKAFYYSLVTMKANLTE